jgi:peptidoglycan-associated lipoprotein
MKRFLLFTILGAFLALLTPSCSKSDGKGWDNVKTAGRYLNHSIDSLFGKDYESCEIASNDQFTGPGQDEFIALNEQDLKNAASSDGATPQPKFAFGENGVPELESFYAPAGELNDFFRTIYFVKDDHVIRNREDLLALKKLASYLKEHSGVYVVIEGHCDERASASYNLALGTKRSNSVRSFLVKEGINANRLYSISYGKEKPIALGHDEEAWKQNRRSQFKIFEKQ